MVVIPLNKNDFNDYLKRTEAAYKLENEIIEEMLAKGINGLEWLIMHVTADDFRKDSLAQWLKLSPMIAKEKTDPLTLFKDAARLDDEAFYQKYELNWWIAFDEALTYFALMKERDYDRYFQTLQDIYKKEENKECL